MKLLKLALVAFTGVNGLSLHQDGHISTLLGKAVELLLVIFVFLLRVLYVAWFSRFFKYMPHFRQWLNMRYQQFQMLEQDCTDNSIIYNIYILSICLLSLCEPVI